MNTAVLLPAFESDETTAGKRSHSRRPLADSDLEAIEAQFDPAYVHEADGTVILFRSVHAAQLGVSL